MAKRRYLKTPCPAWFLFCKAYFTTKRTLFFLMAQLNQFTESINGVSVYLVNSKLPWALVVSQLVELLLLTPEIRGSNLIISKIFFIYQLYNSKDENKEKRGREWPTLTKASKLPCHVENNSTQSSTAVWQNSARDC